MTFRTFPCLAMICIATGLFCQDPPKPSWKFDLTKAPGWRSPDYLVGKSWPSTVVAMNDSYVFVSYDQGFELGPPNTIHHRGLLLKRSDGSLVGSLGWDQGAFYPPKAFFNQQGELVLIRRGMNDPRSLTISTLDPGTFTERKEKVWQGGARYEVLPSCDSSQLLVQELEADGTTKPVILVLHSSTLDTEATLALGRTVLGSCGTNYLASGYANPDGPLLGNGKEWKALGAGAGYPAFLGPARIVLSDTRGQCNCVDWIDHDGKHIAGFQWTVKHAQVGPAVTAFGSGRFAVNVLIDHAPKWINSAMLHRFVAVFDAKESRPILGIDIPTTEFKSSFAISPDGNAIVLQRKDAVELYRLP